MTLIPIRVLIINKQLGFATKTKKALEQIGGFEVSPFTSASAALEHLGQRPHDVVLLDFTLPDAQGIDLVLHIRAIQPDIGIIASPNRPEVASVVEDLELNGIIDTPIGARQLIPLIERVVAHMRDMLPDTAEAPAVGEDSETLTIAPPEGLPEFSSLDSVLVRFGGFEATPGSETLDVDMSDAEQAEMQSIEFILKGEISNLKPSRAVEEPTEDQAKIFQQLAAEEPPMPTLEESGTVGDLMLGVGDSDLREVVEILRRSDVSQPPAERKERAPSDSEGETAPEDPIPAQMILQSALDETKLLMFSLDKLLTNIQEKLPEGQRGVQPLPSWIQEIERYVREPEFLPQTLPELEQTGDISIQTTRMAHSEDVEAHPEELDTDRFAPPTDTRAAPPPVHLPEAPPGAELEDYSEPYTDAELLPQVDEQRTQSELADEASAFQPAEIMETLPPAETAAETAPSPQPPQAPLEVEFGPRVTLGTESEDPRVAQLALSLTQISLELTAEATLLARDGDIVAYAGILPLEDVEDLREILSGDWEAAPEEARIRFVTSPSSGKDYMLYSRRTAGEFTLSMIFGGNMPLRVIRRQSDRLVEALDAVPESLPAEEAAAENIIEGQLADAAISLKYAQTDVEELPGDAGAAAREPAPPVPVGPLTAYTYIWLVRDPENALSDEVSQAVVAGLDFQLTRMGWNIQSLEVAEDYVYMRAGVPGETSAHEIIADLKRRASEVAFGSDQRIDPEHLWADSYLTVLPGRELKMEEIQRFINFARSR